MRFATRFLSPFALCLALLATAACQSPTDPSDALSTDDAVDVAATPNPILADSATSGRTYRIVRGNNQPDDIAAYDWHAIFGTTVSVNSNATDDDLDFAFPIRLTSASLVVRQASGGIVTPPTGTEKEYYEFVTYNASGNTLPEVGSGVSMMFEVWYDLPALRKEAVVTVTYTFVDNDGLTISRSADFNIAP